MDVRVGIMSMGMETPRPALYNIYYLFIVSICMGNSANRACLIVKGYIQGQHYIHSDAIIAMILDLISFYIEK